MLFLITTQSMSYSYSYIMERILSSLKEYFSASEGMSIPLCSMRQSFCCVSLTPCEFRSLIHKVFGHNEEYTTVCLECIILNSNLSLHCFYTRFYRFDRGKIKLCSVVTCCQWLPYQYKSCKQHIYG